MQTPTAKYESINLEKYKPRTMITKIVKTEKDQRTEYKIAKKDGPAPGLYNVENSLVKT